VVNCEYVNCRCSAIGGQSSVIKLKVFHRNFVGRDDFLGQVSVDSQEFKVHDRPRARYINATASVSVSLEVIL